MERGPYNRERAGRPSRRAFLRGALGVAAALPAGRATSGRAFAAEDGVVSADAHPERVLVMVELSGGNDGFDTLVPFRDDAYHRARPTLRHRDRPALHASDDHAFHPSLRGLARLWADGRLAVVQGCGYPRSSRSHFTAMEHWHTGVPDRVETLGWIGRMADARFAAGGDAVLVDTGRRPSPALRARRHAQLALSRPDRCGDGADSAAPQARALDAVRAHRTSPTYGDTSIGNDLRRIAALIAAGLSTRVFYASLGGFDTHASQASGRARLLGALDEALCTFDHELRRIGRDRDVVTMVFSEFGRRLEENASLGTDHGTAGPVLVLGGSVNPGFHGAPPSLRTLDVDGHLVPTTDFRRIYAAIAADWFGMADTRALLGGDFEPLGILA
jgi:uncharacterized protein (DUF1501 family)